jgi:DNA polymerase-3 subunit epsilon
MQFQWAILDIETSGSSLRHDKIIEIAVLILTEKGVEQIWHRKSSPVYRFEESAHELSTLLEGCVLVASNARIKYGFLKNAFKKAGLRLQLPILCSLKLFKEFYPHLPQYDLMSLAEFFSLSPEVSSNVKTNVDLLCTLLNKLITKHSFSTVMATGKWCYQKSYEPFKLITNIAHLPKSYGVYLFYGSHDTLPLYIGKSINLKQRVISHFQSDHMSGKEFAIARQVERVEIIPTAGELSALLLESQLIKEKMPIYNRRLRRKKMIAGFQLENKKGYLAVHIVRESVNTEESSNLYGAYCSIKAATDQLLKLMKDAQLCAKLCGLEKGVGPCFSYQLKRCKGACLGKEPASHYNERVESRMAF